MDIKDKWELILKYVSLRKEATLRGIKFYKTKELFQKSNTFGDLLISMEVILNGEGENLSLFEPKNKNIKIINIEFPASIDEIVLFDEYCKFPFLTNIDSWKVPFLFIKGNNNNLKEILYSDNGEAVSIVGSRETPTIYRQWIEERMPKNKIIVSDLANGADLIGHRTAIEMNKKNSYIPGLWHF